MLSNVPQLDRNAVLNQPKQPQLESPRTTYEQANCALCGSDHTTVFIRGRGPAQIVKCRNDGLLYLNPRPKQANVRDFHTHYVREDNVEIFASPRMEVLRKEADEIKSIKPRGKLLDVGCATGVFFEFFDRDSWDLYGTETTAMAAESARSRYGADTTIGTLREAHYPMEFFDVVSILDTIYFFSDPKQELIEVRRILKADGILAVEIPGILYRFIRGIGPLCWLLDRKWSSISTDSWHLYYFSPRTMHRLLEAAGFRIIAVHPEQASLGRGGVARFINSMHFLIARGLFYVTSGKLSIAGKELYLAVKAQP